MSKPDLSVAIIFKNEIRCLERCLKSIQPLRERVSVQLVMADTGSTDGSRAVAERYADVLFDFPWIDDFAAARNAVLDRCRGRWTLSLDADEWLDPDVDQLVEFLHSKVPRKYNAATLPMRNYLTKELDRYAEFYAVRLMRMESLPRFEGAIHESPKITRPGEEQRAIALEKMWLHHDGYVVMNDGSEAGKAKMARNVALLRRDLEREPENLNRLLQFLESGDDEPDFYDELRRAVSLVVQKKPEWERYGPAILREAVLTAHNDGLPEFDEWARLARELFPDSYLIRVDVIMLLAAHARDRTEDHEAVIRYGEAYLRACAELRADPQGAINSMLKGTLMFSNETSQQEARIVLGDTYIALGQYEKVLPLFDGAFWSAYDASLTKKMVLMLRRLRDASGIDIRPLLNEMWLGIREPIPSVEAAQARIDVFLQDCNVTVNAPARSPTEELAALAERVKAILAKLPPDDPMAIELKTSEAYKKIAFLLEE